MDKVQQQRLDRIFEELKGFPPESYEWLRELLSRHSYASRLNANHNVEFFGEYSCSKIDLIMLSGSGVTNDVGKATISVNELLCSTMSEGVPTNRAPLVITREPNVVVTTRNPAPSFATLNNSWTTAVWPNTLVVDREDRQVDRRPLENLVIEVTTWKHDGTISSNTTFSWICTIEAARIISFG